MSVNILANQPTIRLVLFLISLVLLAASFIVEIIIPGQGWATALSQAGNVFGVAALGTAIANRQPLAGKPSDFVPKQQAVTISPSDGDAVG